MELVRCLQQAPCISRSFGDGSLLAFAPFLRARPVAPVHHLPPSLPSVTASILSKHGYKDIQL